MNRYLLLGALLSVPATLVGCAAVEPIASATPSAAVTSAAAVADSGLGAAKESGDLPDPCTLLTEKQVFAYTTREVTRIDEDDAGPGAITRFCQWQQSNGQLAVFLTRTTPADFEVTIAEAAPVADLGENAYHHSGHLYVLYGTVQIDVYSRGNTDQQNLADAKKVASAMIPDL